MTFNKTPDGALILRVALGVLLSDYTILSGICSHCLKLFGNGVNKQEAGLVNMPKPALYLI